MTDPTRLLARLAELRATAEAAHRDAPDGWEYQVRSMHMDGRSDGRVYAVGTGKPSVAQVGLGHYGPHIEAWDPSAALLWIEWAEDVARRHVLYVDDTSVRWCEGHADMVLWDRCEEIPGLARALGLEET